MYKSQAQGSTDFTYQLYTDMAARVDLNSSTHMNKKITDTVTSSPSADSFTSRTDDEWLLESFLVSESLSKVECTWDTMASFLPSSLPNCPCLLSQCFSSELLQAGTRRSVSQDPDIKPNNQHRSVEECERRRARRERNRIAAARCRDRRRILTDTLENETEQLERVKAQLEAEIAGLQKEKERLELVLEVHKPACKMEGSNPE